MVGVAVGPASKLVADFSVLVECSEIGRDGI